MLLPSIKTPHCHAIRTNTDHMERSWPCIQTRGHESSHPLHHTPRWSKFSTTKNQRLEGRRKHQKRAAHRKRKKERKKRKNQKKQLIVKERKKERKGKIKRSSSLYNSNQAAEQVSFFLPCKLWICWRWWQQPILGFQLVLKAKGSSKLIFPFNKLGSSWIWHANPFFPPPQSLRMKHWIYFCWGQCWQSK